MYKNIIVPIKKDCEPIMFFPKKNQTVKPGFEYLVNISSV